MMPWAACLLCGDARVLAALRLRPDVAFAAVGGAIWLRGPSLEPDLENELKKIPGLERFELLPEERLRPVHSRIADRRLPPAHWAPLQSAIEVVLPLAAWPGATKQKLPVVLARTSVEKEASALLTSMALWTQFAEQAALVRLECLRFAAMETGQVFVCGNPLPSLPGLRFAARQDIFVPCGFCWSPPVDADVLRRLFQLSGEAVVLLHEDNTHQVIRPEQFMPAKRSAVRLTFAELNHA